MSRILIQAPCLASILLGVFLTETARADNNTHSNWTLNISEGGMSPAPAKNDDMPEIAVVGSTVHVLWIADDIGGACNQCVIWYRRSRDNGKTWDPRVMIAAADKNLETVYEANRLMAVDNQNVVHVAWNTSPPSNGFDGIVQYRRSKDGGTTWDAVKTLYDINQYPWWTTISVISTDGVKTSIATMVTSDRAGGGWIQLLTTADGGNTFSSTSVFGTATTDSWYLLDAKRAGDRTYVLYSDVSNLYGHVAKDYVTVVPDSGAKLGPYLVSVPAKDGNHYATIWLSNNYSPKIAVSADKAYVVFGCEDANNVERAMMRRFTNYGASLDPTVIASDTDPDGSINSPDDVSVAANGSYGMMVYHVDLSDKYGGIAKTIVKRYSESAQAPVAAAALFNKQSYYRGSIYPTIMAGSNQNAYVMWQAPTLTRSADSFNTWVMPVIPEPMGTWTAIWPTRLKTTVGSDGTVHWVEVGALQGGKGDSDIIYGNWAPAPAPGSVNKALSLTTSATGYRYDAMQAPSSAATTNFTTAMTMALWVQVQPGGVTTGTTDVFMPIVQKAEYAGGFSYLLGTDFPAPNRVPTAAIATTTKSYLLQPPTNQFILVEGQWYHLALTYDSTVASNNFKLYVNGNMAAQATAAGPLATGDGPLFVGQYGNWQVDDLSLWNRALSQTEIATILTAPLKGNESGLALYYNFDDTTAALNNPNASGVLQFQESFVASTALYGTPPLSGTTSLAIANPSFETLPSNPQWIDCSGSGGAGCRDTSDGNIPGWAGSGTMGFFQPGASLFALPLPAAEGQTVVYLNSGTLSQTLGAALQASAIYTLQVDVGRRLDNTYPSTPPTVQLFAGNTLIASATGPQPPLGGWTTWTGSYQSSNSDPLAGQALRIVLGTTSPQADFDNVRLTAAGQPASSMTIVNGASFTSGAAVAAESIVSIFGSHLAVAGNPGGTSVAVKDAGGTNRNATTFFASPAQVNFQVPAGTANGVATVTVTAADSTTTSGTVQVLNCAPGLFAANSSGLFAGSVLRVRGDGSQNPENDYQLDANQNVIPLPVSLGPSTDQVFLTLYGTGIRHASSVTATVGGKTIPVPFAGAQGAFVGEDQINLGPLPQSLAGSGKVNVVITADGQPANTVNLTIQ